jgi:hypothetical protein
LDLPVEGESFRLAPDILGVGGKIEVIDQVVGHTGVIKLSSSVDFASRCDDVKASFVRSQGHWLLAGLSCLGSDLENRAELAIIEGLFLFLGDFVASIVRAINIERVSLILGKSD